jgi:hypothetical protein
MKRTYSTLNDCEMQHNAEVGLFYETVSIKIKIIEEGNLCVNNLYLSDTWIRAVSFLFHLFNLLPLFLY